MNFYNLLFKKNSEKEEFVRDNTFYSETLSIMKYYLAEYSKGTSSEMLSYFVEKIGLLRFSKFRNTKINGKIINEFSNCDIENNYNSIQKFRNCKNDKRDAKNLHFLKQIRFCVLNSLGRKDIKSKNLLKEYHRIIYLIELSFREDISMFERVNDFLNTNYQLEDNDFKGHSIRGNFKEMIRIKPEMKNCILEIQNILHNSDQNKYFSSKNLDDENKEYCEVLDDVYQNIDFYNEEKKEIYIKKIKQKLLEKVRIKYKIDNNMWKIINGEYKHFESEMEEVCYDLAYKNEKRDGVEELDLLSGDFDCLIEKTNGWLRLVILFISDKTITLEEFENLFEKVYFQICDMEYQTALEYLAYSRKCQYYFNIFVKKININRGIMGLFMSYVHINKLDGTFLEQKYLNYLKSEKDYDTLCSYIAEHNVIGFEYTYDIVRHFIENYVNYKISDIKKFSEDKNNLFIVRLNSDEEDMQDILNFLLEHEYSEFMLEKIVERVVICKSNIKELIPKVLELIVKQEKMTGKPIRKKLMKKLFALLV